MLMSVTTAHARTKQHALIPLGVINVLVRQDGLESTVIMVGSYYLHIYYIYVHLFLEKQKRQT